MELIDKIITLYPELKIEEFHPVRGTILLQDDSDGKGPNGYKQSEETKQKIRLKVLNYKHKIVTCPKCNTTGGITSMKRWHFDNCTGAKIHKARVYHNGQRIYLGRFATKEQVTDAINQFKRNV